MITRHRNYKGLFLFTICILVVTSMVLSPLLVSCVPSVTEEEGALPEEEAAPELQAEGKTIIVTSTADSGPSTLRQALQDAQSGDTITFDPAVFPPSAPVTIYLTIGLPHITQGNLTIDASNAGVILDGSNISEDWSPGLEVNSDGNTIWGMQMVNFSPGAGISLSGGTQNNVIGGDRRIGSEPLGQGNLVSNGDIGICLCDDGTSFNTITGNLIGTDASGADARSNSSSGIWIENGASRNIIGPDNIIAYNQYGITSRDLNSLGNTITQNSIHDNKEGGIYLWGGGNSELNAPLIIDFDLAGGTVTGAAAPNSIVEIFSDSKNEGEIYEGQAKADGTGAFTFNKGSSFTGPYLTATATDADGNTSSLSEPTLGTSRTIVFQEGNNLSRTQLQTKQSKELEHNRIGQMAGLDVDAEQDVDAYIYQNNEQFGFKWIRLTIDWFDWWEVESTGEYSEYYVNPYQDKAITGLVENGIKIMYTLVFWDEAIQAREGYSRFKTEDEIQRYLDYVRFIVHHFKDRIEYYEILNEPNIEEGTQQYVELADYIKLVNRVVPVIRQEYPEAKIVVGAVTPFAITPGAQEYFFGILSSDAMPLVDAVSWHAGDGTSPEYMAEFYYDIPSLVQEMKDVASAHGFTGQCIIEEMHWRTPKDPHPYEYSEYGEIPSAKYYGRGIVMYLGMGLTTGLALEALDELRLRESVIRNLCTVMAGAEPASLSVEIQSEATNIRSYGFSLSNGDRLLALWTDSEAVDDDPGVEATLTFPGFSAQKVTGIDVLNGFEQEVITSFESGNLVIQNLLVKDYPIILRLIH